MYNIDKHRKTDYTTQLLRQKEHIFHTQDLAVLWNIPNKRTLYMTIQRYKDRGILFPIHKGLYSTLPVEQLDPALLGQKALHNFSYVSCETILSNEGFINRIPSAITYVSTSSKWLTIGKQTFRSRQLHEQFLFHPFGITEINGVRRATTIRAITDMLYFNPVFHFDAPIDWQEVLETQKIIGYSLTKKRYAHSTS